jgi:hypothetical protein
METQFTPGPWEVCKGNKGSIFGDLDNPKHDGDNPYIGTVAGIGSDDDHPENTANAHLIASAPDLFEALRLALPYIENAYECAFPDADHNDNVLTMARAALARATGQPYSPVTNQ